ncbi:MAG: HD domain-containing protein [Microcoleus sp. PH2017_29_MFU_D_A]|uniref:HD domain-containing phosphohydrolase n=1 Tax=unclassified Microcoleus TaxID=2642155 RepID=UPI001D545F09|nr:MULTISPECIES: HD domain-containing phosphohydrolase [unclassified Microcoleus]MCC3420873.1 HD domain-containing protein [Microcoleus sp. PH2017_07_MST_O_A]MCC3513533.1 HD domain-containing protein [Microcoleus sp. PH2017_17_BER_D_A]TAG75112.1 MAG: HD domain-containing protein [Oscillatoriales cyanobacterium]MCC3457642.1 HD domain-containing protein [Microcoleus sp. PH2017_08_TRC_O_A]MCC3476288.1 HD domain-containing protein [Microcoleus sp. PH2017_13_LAR_U_A]
MIVFERPEFLNESAQRTELIEKLLDIGAALSSAPDLGGLLNLILSKSREITYSDAGSVYLVDHSDEKSKLLFKVAQNGSKPRLSFKEFALPLTDKSLAGYVAITGQSLNLSDAYDLPPDVPYQLDTSFDRDINYRTCSVMVLPMQNRQGETIGVLQLINRKKKADEVLTAENAWESTQQYSEWEERIVRSLASQAAISIERNQLQESIEHLFEGFVKASVQVIEARDPCTFGHSERVAALTVRLSEEVNAVSNGWLRSIYFNNRQIQEIRYAALLHDFGKIGVPEAVLTKQKKLYPSQLEIIRHRFALAQRTLEMECVQSKYKYLLEHSAYRKHPDSGPECAKCQEIEQLDTALADAKTRLAEYWEVLLEANEPHILAEEPLAQLLELSRQTYRDIDGAIKPLLSPDEIVQLMVSRGNLTPTERSAIESHVTHTYEFLSQIPWTKDLKNVPQIAYGHHEKLDGTGYPRGLTDSEIPIQAQLMTIADIYDALTAGDRPYKRALRTDAAMKILRQEAAHNKINADLLELFDRRRVFSVLGHGLDAKVESV